MYDVLIIGCGVTGAAAAFELSRYRLRVGIVERENDVALGTTKANSAILHAGYDPEPGTLMARLNVRGVELARELCQKLDVPYRPCGSLVLAFSEEERPALEELYRRGQANGVPGLKLLDGAVARSLEPNLSETVVAALHAPSAAICSPWEYCLALAETAVKNGAELHLNTAVTGLERTSGGWTVRTTTGDFEARFVLNAAGVDAAGVHDLAAPHSFDIRPARGQYYLLDKSEGGRVSRVIFQCPSAAGKGVLVAPTVHGNLIVGPDSEKVEGNDTAPPGTACASSGRPPGNPSPPSASGSPSGTSPGCGPPPAGRTSSWRRARPALSTWRASARRGCPPPPPSGNTRRSCWPRRGWPWSGRTISSANAAAPGSRSWTRRGAPPWWSGSLPSAG